jgi:hypothetical protein
MDRLHRGREVHRDPNILRRLADTASLQ